MIKKLFILLTILPVFTYGITLEDAIEYAKHHNLSIKSTYEEVNQAKAGKLSSISNFIPDISLNGSYTRLNEAPSIEIPAMIPGQSPMTITMGNINNWDGKLQVQQPLFTWGKMFQGYKIAEDNLKSSQIKYSAKKDSLTIQVISIYYGAIMAREFSALMNNTIKDVSGHVEIVRKRYNEGQASKFDLLSAETQLANLIPQKNRANNSYSLALKGFRMLLGDIDDTALTPEGEILFKEEILNEDSIKHIALTNNYSVKILRLTKNIVKRSVKIAKTANLPTFLGLFVYDYKWPDGMNERWKGSWAANLVVSCPLFNGGKTLSDIRKANSNLRIIEFAEKQLNEGITMAVHSLYSNYNLALENCKAQKVNVMKAREALDIAKIQYDEGLITNTNYMDAEVGLMKANVYLLQSKYDAIVNYYQIKYITGNISEEK
ncbi:hypothetical protein DRP43_02490 [candidate division TA06 bacterium]|uniref:TolC family protein n=1 Tax=candidate division TA06 bacterium TaxID=2250710 RepID=A0A660SN05_UNCT6|nr:MAG: hypothetical protein DRP43_02490 [candidate division TA06 bacterium]